MRLDYQSTNHSDTWFIGELIFTMIEWEELEIEIEYDSEAEELTERATSRDLRYLIHVIFEIKTIEDNR